MPEMVTHAPEVKRIQQESTSQCWLASCKMLFKWKRRNPDDVDKILIAASKDPQSPVDYDYWCREGVGHGDVVPLARALGLMPVEAGPLTLTQMLQRMRLGPMLACGEWTGSSHAVVVWAAENVDDKDRANQAYLWIANPYFGKDEKEVLTLGSFNSGLGSWSKVNGFCMHW